jgi:hypothetical protein
VNLFWKKEARPTQQKGQSRFILYYPYAAPSPRLRSAVFVICATSAAISRFAGASSKLPNCRASGGGATTSLAESAALGIAVEIGADQGEFRPAPVGAVQ